MLSDVKNISVRRKTPVTCVFDVGSNRGNFSIEALNSFPCARTYAFEPHPKTYQDLVINIQNERFHAFEIALSDSAGVAELFDYGGGGHINSLVDNARYAVRFEQKAQSITINKQTLDEFCHHNNIHEISILKIDTEGNDLRVLVGAQGFLKEIKIEFVYFEFNYVSTKDCAYGGSLREIAEFLAGFGFKFLATYTDYVVTDGGFFAVANCLMMR